MIKWIALFAGLAFLVMSAPALAAQDRRETESQPQRSPALAAGLAVVAPTALIILSSQSTDFIVNFSVPVLGLGAGHVYAGDPLRGALVTVGSTAVGLGTFALLHRSGGNGGGGAYAVGMFSVGLAVGLAAADAYWTTEQKNREALSAFGIAAPFGFGAGHAYAGDPARGAYGLYGPNDDDRPRRLMTAGTNAAIATMVYSGWAAYDAYHTADRRKQTLLDVSAHE